MIDLIIGLAVGFGAGFSLMAYRLMVIERRLADHLFHLIENVKELRP